MLNTVFGWMGRLLALTLVVLMLGVGLARAGDPVLEVVSAPNPHVFPLLVAMEMHPDLPVHLTPISGGPDMKAAFDHGADVLLAMTYIGAKARMSGDIPDLKLVLPVTWRGFWEMAPADVKSFQDLQGKTVLISGPVGAGKGGGDDIIFRAAVRRQGLDPDRDMNVVYKPIKEAQQMMSNGEADALAVPSPASTGFAMESRMNGGKLVRAIDFQKVFSGYASFPQDQLPLGGIFVTERVLNDPARSTSLQALIRAYAEAADELEHHPLYYANVATKAFNKYYGGMDIPQPPSQMLMASLMSGDLIFRTDISVGAVQSDLNDWLGELLGQAPGKRLFVTDYPAPSTAFVQPRRPMMRLFMPSGSQ